MVNVAEHVYHDDPTVGHPDVRTRLAGVSYFFLGNGDIQAAVQFAPQGEGTPLGLLIMDPDRLGKKRDSLSMDPVHGLSATVLRLGIGKTECAPELPNLEVAWLAGCDVPTVEARWHSERIHVAERFSCPEGGTPRLARDVSVTGADPAAGLMTLRVGPPDSPTVRTLDLDADGRARILLVYELDRRAASLTVRVLDDTPAAPTSRGHADRTTVAFHDPLLDHLFGAARCQLPAAVSSRGCLDGSIWQYNREWVRDQAAIALALTQLGHRHLAATMLRRLLTDFVTPEGATLDSSEVRGRDDVELDQNGMLLYVLEQYVSWTGDRRLIEDHWDRVQALADYPLRDEFRHGESGMLSGSREYWERHATHGIEPGLELVYQMFVSMGLSRAATLARLLGHLDHERRWLQAAHDLRQAWLSHPTWALQDARGFVKRRGLDGRVQEQAVARPDAGLPAGVPLASPGPHWLNPDTCAVLPIVFGLVDPASSVAQATLDSMETIWNQGWDTGGYGRYHVTSEPDSPGPWPFASLFVARAHVEAGRSEPVWRTLRWMRAVSGGLSGAWFEFYGQRYAPPFPQVGIVPWTWAELVLLFVHHILGVRPGANGVYLRPRLLAGLQHVEASIPVGTGWLDVTLYADESAAPVSTVVPCPVGRTRLTIPVRTLP
ncbi:MAG: hypothetical protein Q7V01_03950 [Vicinamibacterales bacterium]|nr:hypothetical protein [Vicinamibacterales bacterium]